MFFACPLLHLLNTPFLNSTRLLITLDFITVLLKRVLIGYSESNLVALGQFEVTSMVVVSSRANCNNNRKKFIRINLEVNL